MANKHTQLILINLAYSDTFYDKQMRCHGFLFSADNNHWSSFN